MRESATRVHGTKTLSFSTSHVEAMMVEDARDLEVAGRTIVTNVGASDADLENVMVTNATTGSTARVPLPLRPWQSTTLQDATIFSAESLILLRIASARNLGDLVLTPGWELLGSRLPESSDFPRNTPLWISPQDELGTIELDPFRSFGRSNESSNKQTFRLKANLWYAPPGTDCFIHAGHPFLEVHTQVLGTGRMQKFRNRDAASLYEEVVMAVGQTHSPFFTIDEKGEILYPWHRYLADTDCVWMALELHPTEAHPPH